MNIFKHLCLKYTETEAVDILPLLSLEWQDWKKIQKVTELTNFFFSFYNQTIWYIHQFSSVTQLCPTLCDPMNRCTPGLPVHHQIPESTQTHVRWVGDAIQPSRSLLSPSPPAFNLSHIGVWVSQLFESGGQSIGVSASVSVLPMNAQDWSPLGWTGWISLQSKGLSRVFSNTTVQKHQFFGAQLSSQSNSYINTWPQ